MKELGICVLKVEVLVLKLVELEQERHSSEICLVGG